MNKKVITISVLVIMVLGLLLYWYELRPIQIRKNCIKIAINKFPENLRDAYTLDTHTRYFYWKCLKEKGFE